MDHRNIDIQNNEKGEPCSSYDLGCIGLFADVPFMYIDSETKDVVILSDEQLLQP